MKKQEIIELNGVEYTLELNRDSAVQIDKYTNMQKSLEKMNEDIIEYVDEIEDDENPFEDLVDIEKVQEQTEEKLKILQKIIIRAFWIWLYPKHKLNINKVEEIINPYFEDEDKMEFISIKYGEYFRLSTEISQKYIKEQKNLKALTNK